MDTGYRARPLLRGDPGRLGDYRLLGRLGSGGMGVVYLAEHPDGGLVAVKLVHAQLSGDAEFRARFRSEVDRARQVPSFCTAEVFDADLDHEPPYLVVEYVDGPSLAEVVDERGPLSPANLHSVAVGVATALAGIHGAGVIHRDLKPENVLLAPGSPKVIDFGIARAFEATSQHTRTDQFVGTVAYMAPERFSSQPGTPLTAAADIFAWGCVIGYAGTGRTPFHGDSPPATAARILTQPPHLDGLAEPLRGLVELSLAKEPADRPTATELLDMLVGGSGPGRPVATVVPPRPDPPVRGLSRSWLPAVLAAVLILAGLATLGWVVTGAPGREPAVIAESAPSPATTEGSPEPEPPAARPGKPEPTGGEPIIQTELARPGLWLDTEGRDASCRTRGVMRATLTGAGAFQCAGPDEVIADDFGAEVTAALLSAGSCAAIWFHWDPERGGHVARICRDEISVGADRPDDRRVFGRIELDRALPLAKAARVHVVVRGTTVDTWLDGAFAGSVRLPARGATEGQIQLGVTAASADLKPPHTVTFGEVDIRSL